MITTLIVSNKQHLKQGKVHRNKCLRWMNTVQYLARHLLNELIPACYIIQMPMELPTVLDTGYSHSQHFCNNCLLCKTVDSRFRRSALFSCAWFIAFSHISLCYCLVDICIRKNYISGNSFSFVTHEYSNFSNLANANSPPRVQSVL